MAHCKTEFDKVRRELRRLQDLRAKERLKSKDQFEIVCSSFNRAGDGADRVEAGNGDSREQQTTGKREDGGAAVRGGSEGHQVQSGRTD